MEAKVRKIVRFVDETLIEGGREAASPLLLIGVAAVIANPWAGRGFVEDLQPAIRAQAPGLGERLTAEVIALAGGGDKVEAYGKAAVVGEAGEVEHASAMIHTLRFGNHFRTAVGAETYLSFTNMRGGPNAPVVIPMMDKHDAGRRSHYLTLQFAIPDAPATDEIVVALGASIGGRPHHRIGDRYQDLADMGKGADDAPV
ncbi:MAG: amino acid synthesis family protein [Pseudomonadota bacterium]